MADDLHAHFGEPATYTPMNGQPTAVTVIVRRPDRIIST